MATSRFVVPTGSTIFHIEPRCRSHQTSSFFYSDRRVAISKQNDWSRFVPNGRSLRYVSRKTKMDLIVSSSVEPGAPLPSDPSPNNCRKSWILGAVITIILPFFRHKWGPLFKLTKDVESVVERAEHVTEAIEKVAGEVETLADDVADKLPEGGKLRGAIEAVENAAKETEKDAHLLQDVINKVEKVDEDVEAFIEPVKDEPTETANKEATDQK